MSLSLVDLTRDVLRVLQRIKDYKMLMLMRKAIPNTK